MNNIFSHIEYLLYRHDCVIVPQLGAFVVRQIPAEYDAATSAFLPPRRQILFNPELTHSDGLLTASVARKCGISYERATSEVEEQVSKIKGELSSANSRCSAGTLGLLIRAPHGAITFEPAHRFFATPSLFSLPAVSVTTVEEREEMDRMSRKSHRISFPNILRVAASILVLIVVGFLTTTPLPVDESSVHKASLSLPKISVPDTPAKEFQSVEITLNLAVPADSLSAFTVITQQELDRLNSTVKISDSDPYYLVVASTVSQRQAQAFIESHPDFYLETVNFDGRIRIIAATAHTPAELRDLHRDRLAEEFPEAWPCHR